MHGGIESYILNIIDHIDRNIYEIELAIPGKWKQENEDSLICRNIKVIHYDIVPFSKQVQSIRSILKSGKYDIVHVMQSYVTLERPAVFAIVALMERYHYHYKLICHAHGTEDTSKRRGFAKKLLCSMYRQVLRNVFCKADVLAACSQEAGCFMYGNNANVNVLYNGINLDRFTRQPNALLREKYRISDDKMNIVAVGRMSEEKNPVFALETIKNLVSFYPDLRFIWVGDGALMSQVRQCTVELGITSNVSFLGNQDNVEEILSCCDYFFLPSKREGFGIVFIEAQAAGLYCFTSDRVPSIIDCGGVSFIELNKSAEEWAAEIHRQLGKEPKDKIEEALLRRFDVKETVKVLCEVYDRLVES